MILTRYPDKPKLNVYQVKVKHIFWRNISLHSQKQFPVKMHIKLKWWFDRVIIQNNELNITFFSKHCQTWLRCYNVWLFSRAIDFGGNFTNKLEVDTYYNWFLSLMRLRTRLYAVLLKKLLAIPRDHFGVDIYSPECETSSISDFFGHRNPIRKEGSS